MTGRTHFIRANFITRTATANITATEYDQTWRLLRTDVTLTAGLPESQSKEKWVGYHVTARTDVICHKSWHNTRNDLHDTKCAELLAQ